MVPCRTRTRSRPDGGIAEKERTLGEEAAISKGRSGLIDARRSDGAFRRCVIAAEFAGERGREQAREERLRTSSWFPSE